MKEKRNNSTSWESTSWDSTNWESTNWEQTLITYSISNLFKFKKKVLNKDYFINEKFLVYISLNSQK